jgi:hypothetical protein
VTAEGRRELEALRASMLREVVVPADPFDLALACSADVPTSDLLGIVEDRAATLQTRAAELEHLRLSAAEHLDERDRLLFEHALTRLHAELDWHHELHSALSRAITPQPQGEQ